MWIQSASALQLSLPHQWGVTWDGKLNWAKKANTASDMVFNSISHTVCLCVINECVHNAYMYMCVCIDPDLGERQSKTPRWYVTVLSNLKLMSFM